MNRSIQLPVEQALALRSFLSENHTHAQVENAVAWLTIALHMEQQEFEQSQTEEGDRTPSRDTTLASKD